MSTADVYRITDKLDDPTLDVLVTRLEARGKHPHFMRMMQEYLDVMRIDSAATVLDLGCGTGVVSRTIARRTGFRAGLGNLTAARIWPLRQRNLPRRKGSELSSNFARVIRTVSIIGTLSSMRSWRTR
jgi:hypothetical protein